MSGWSSPTLSDLAFEARAHGYVVTLAILPDGRFIRVDLSPDLLADHPDAAGQAVAYQWARLYPANSEPNGAQSR